MSSVKNNITLNYGFEFISNLNFTQALWVSYLAFKGLTLVEIGLCESVFHIASLIFEVPTGIIADRFGRKLSRILGICCKILYLSLLLLVNNFVFAMFSFVFAALSYNLESGADSAFVYDSLLENGTHEHFPKIQGYREIIFQTASLVGIMTGGLLADVSYTLAISAAIGIFALGFIIALFFKEPRVIESTEKTTMKALVKTSLLTLKNQPRLAGLMVYSALFLSVSATFFFYLSPYLRGLGYSLTMISLWYMINSVGSIIASLMVNKLIKKFDLKLVLYASLIMTMTFVFLPILPWGTLAFFFMGAFESILYVMMVHHINRQIGSEVRATILSVNAMAYSVIMAIMFPVFGAIGDRFGLRLAFTLMAILMACFVLGFGLWQRRGSLTGPRFFDIMNKK
ncbi:MAG: major facilitator superfamily protein [Erysipelotrichaceae bacterium]|nr:MAG: major facilitator superfamily [Erysipelotrichaceae bacterium]TXT17450.1 MAG: major facilitator superfamily protein [Erysipelotrichaceae bacterium]